MEVAALGHCDTCDNTGIYDYGTGNEPCRNCSRGRKGKRDRNFCDMCGGSGHIDYPDGLVASCHKCGSGTSSLTENGTASGANPAPSQVNGQHSQDADPATTITDQPQASLSVRWVKDAVANPPAEKPVLVDG
jgi:hypothetical protein